MSITAADINWTLLRETAAKCKALDLRLEKQQWYASGKVSLTGTCSVRGGGMDAIVEISTVVQAVLDMFPELAADLDGLLNENGPA